MKAVFPKNIKKGLLSGFILAIGIALALVTFTKFQESSKAVGTIFAIIIAGIFITIAFFNVSELNILAFFAKLIQNRFFDTTEKFQTMNEKPSKSELAIRKHKIDDKKQKIDYKTNIELDNVNELDTSGLI